MSTETRRESLSQRAVKKFLDWSDRVLMGEPMVVAQVPVPIPAQRVTNPQEDLHLLWEQAIANEDWDYARQLETQHLGKAIVQAEVEQ